MSNFFLHEPHLMIFLLDAHRVLVTIKQGIEFHLRPTQPCHSTEEKFVYVFNPSTPCRLLFAPALLFVQAFRLFCANICLHLPSVTTLCPLFLRPFSGGKLVYYLPNPSLVSYLIYKRKGVLVQQIGG